MGQELTQPPAPGPLFAEPGRPPAARPRLDAIDQLRGVVMVLMALDHVRDFFMSPFLDPLDLRKPDPALFLTRWVTHFCAPVFVFLAGTGAYLYGARGKTKGQQAWFLLTRGLWLVVLELTLVHLGWAFNFKYDFLLLQVIWAIGWSMVALAGLVFLPTAVVTALGILLVAGHNLLDGYGPADFGVPGWLWTILLRPGPLQPWPGTFTIVAYPVLPWLGVLAAGYGFGVLWRLERGRRRRWLAGLGLAATLLFVAGRAANGYGDPAPWSAQPGGLGPTVLSFVNCTKYPPSLLFVLMTLGPSLLALAWFDRGPPGPLGRPLVVYGRVPLFYYLLHIPLIHLAALAFALARYGQAGFMFGPMFLPLPGLLPEGYGYGLPVVYLVWAGVVAALYPACRWFADLKRRRKDAWLSYL